MTDQLEAYTDEELEEKIKGYESELRKRKWNFADLKSRLSKTEIKSYQNAIIEMENQLKKLYEEKKRRKDKGTHS